MNINIVRPLTNGALIAVGENVVKKRSAEESIKDGAIMAGASIVSQTFVNSKIAGYTPNGTSLIISDGLVYAALEAFRKSERDAGHIFYNFVEGVSASFINAWLCSSIANNFNPLLGVQDFPGVAAIYGANANNINSINTSIPIPTGGNTLPNVPVPNPNYYATL